MSDDRVLRRRKALLTVNGCAALAIGSFALTMPSVLLVDVKLAEPSAAANVMARTVGVLIMSMGFLSVRVRGDEDSPTLRSVVIANLLLHLGLLPIDPLAYASGAFRALGSFVPNTVLHLLLSAGLAFALVDLRGQQGTARVAGSLGVE
jgi:hypothetical protein